MRPRGNATGVSVVGLGLCPKFASKFFVQFFHTSFSRGFAKSAENFALKKFVINHYHFENRGLSTEFTQIAKNPSGESTVHLKLCHLCVVDW